MKPDGSPPFDSRPTLAPLAQGRPLGRAVLVLALGVLALVAACKREERTPRVVPPGAIAHGITESDLHPGETSGTAGTTTGYEENAYAISEGQRLFDWYNCSGCHAHGGGGIGPALMDNKWIYGSDPSNIYETIVEGRPNGMPSFRGKIPTYQVWQLAAYVRSLSGLVPKDAAGGRPDHMSVKQSEQSTPAQAPKKTAPGR